MSHGHDQRAGSVVWNGTLREQLDLMASIQHNCECRFDACGRCYSACAGHLMLAVDQRALDGLLWNRRLVTRLLVEEGISAP